MQHRDDSESPAGDAADASEAADRFHRSDLLGEDQANPLVGIALKVISVAIFVAMMTCIKAAGNVPPGQIVFFRSFFAILPILVFLAARREIATAMRTKHPVSHVMRGVVGVGSMSFAFLGLTLLPLPDAITINYAQPLFVILFGAVFLRERVRIFRWTAVAAGMIGVVILSWPKLSVLTGNNGVDAGQAVGVIAMLTAAMLAASAMLLVRRLVATERTATIVLWFSVTATVFSLVTIPFGWAALGFEQAVLLVSAGVLGGIAQLFMTQAYRHAEISTIAPFEYTSILLGIGAGYYFFQDVPTRETLIGGAIVVAAGIYIIWREHDLGLERRRARKVMTPQG